MQEIKINLKHSAIDKPLGCTMKVFDDEFFIESYHFCSIHIHEERFTPVEYRHYCAIVGFIRQHYKEWRDYTKEIGFKHEDNKVYDLIRANNAREWEKQNNKKQ